MSAIYYKQLSDVTNGKDVSVLIQISVLTLLLDNAMLPNHIKDSIAKQALEQISDKKEGATNDRTH